jgi:hypothetical protein
MRKSYENPCKWEPTRFTVSRVSNDVFIISTRTRGIITGAGIRTSVRLKITSESLGLLEMCERNRLEYVNDRVFWVRENKKYNNNNVPHFC